MLAVRLPENLENELSLYAEMSDKTKTDVVKEALRPVSYTHLTLPTICSV